MNVYLVERRFEYDVSWHVSAAYQSRSAATDYVREQNSVDASDGYRITTVYVSLASGE